MATRNERTKTIKFNMDNPEERELWEKLQRLMHGKFSEVTKQMWKDRLMRKEGGK